MDQGQTQKIILGRDIIIFIQKLFIINKYRTTVFQKLKYFFLGDAIIIYPQILPYHFHDFRPKGYFKSLAPLRQIQDLPLDPKA